MAGRPIKIDLIGDDSQLKKTLKGAGDRIGKFGTSVAKMGVTAGAAFGATAVAIGTKGVMAFSEFQSGMAEVFTLLPEAGEETFKELGDQAKEFSKTFGVSTSDAIDGLYSSLSAGIPPDNVFEFMETAQKAATAGVASLETAVDGISSVLNVYGDEVITAGEASDLMFTAVKLGKTNFEEISASISTMAPIAEAVGVPFETLTASIANLTAGGTPTSVAANQMKAAMAELAKAGTKADTAFRDLSGVGLQQFLAEGGTYEEAIVMMKEGADEAGISVLDMFGSIEAGQGVLALTADGGEKFRETLDEMAASGGATETAFETMDSTLGASFGKIKANLEVLAIEIGEKLAPLVAKATDFMVDNFDLIRPVLLDAKKHVIDFGKRATEIIKSVTKWVKDNEKWLTMVAVAIGAIVLAVKTYTTVVKIQKGVMVAWSKATKIAAGAQAALNAAMALNPIGLVVAAIVVLIAILAAAYFKFETVRDIVDKVFDVFQAMAEMFMDYAWPLIEKVIGLIVKQFKYFWDQIKLAVDLVMSLFKGDFAGAWDALKEMVSNAIGMIIDLFIDLPMDIIRAVVPLAGKLALIVADFYVHLVEKVFGLYKKIIGFFIDLPMDLIRAVAPLVGKFALIVADFSVHLVGKILTLIKGMPDKIIELLGTVASRIIAVGLSLGEKIITGIGNALAAIGSKILNWVHTGINSVFQSIVGLGSDIGGWIINGLLGAITGAADAIWDAIKGLIPGLGDIGGFFGNLFTSGSRQTTFAQGAPVTAPPPGFGSSLKDARWAAEEISRRIASGVLDPASLSRSGGVITSGTPTDILIATGVIREFSTSLDGVTRRFDDPFWAEPVVPFGPGAGLTNWEALGPGGGGGPMGMGETHIDLTVNAGMGTDGHQVGTQIVSALQQWERNNGSLPLNVAAQ